MWTILVFICLSSYAIVLNARVLYYKVGTGQVFGPFEEEQVVSWFRDGYLNSGETLVCNRPDGSFCPIEQSIFPNNAQSPSTPKSRSFMSKLSKKAGSVLQAQRKNIASISKTFTTGSPKLQEELIDDEFSLPVYTEVVESEIEAFSSSGSPAEVSSTSPRPTSGVTADPPTDESVFEEHTDASSIVMTSEEHEEEMLAQLKRDAPTPVAPLALSTRTESTRYHEEEGEPRPVQKYSVRSLAKADYSLWDAEDVDAKKSAQVDAFLSDLDSAAADGGVPLDVNSANVGVIAPSLAHISVVKQLSKQLRALVLELLRFLGACAMSILPGPVQRSVLMVGALLFAQVNRPVLAGLVLLSVVSMLRDVLYLALVPSVFSLLSSIMSVSTSGSTSASTPSAIVIDSEAFNSATAGGIITTVMDQTTSGGDIPYVHAQAQEVSQVYKYINELVRTLRNLNGRTVRHAALASWQCVQSVRLPSVREVQAASQRGMVELRGLVRQLALMEKETLTVVLVIASLVLVQGAFLPFLEAQLAASLITSPPESVIGSDMEDADDEFTEAAPSDKPAWVADCEAQLQRRVSAVGVTQYLRSVSSGATRLVQWSGLLAMLYPSLGVAGNKAQRLLLTPLMASVALCAVELYLQPTGNAPRPARSRSVSRNAPSTDRLAYLCDLVTSARRWADCRRWGLSAYILTLLAHEQDHLRAQFYRMEDKKEHAETSLPLQGASVSTLLFRVKVLFLSVYVWLQLHASGVLQDVDFTHIIRSVLRKSRDAGASSWPVKVSELLLIKPFETLQRVASVWSGTAQNKAGGGVEYVVRGANLAQKTALSRVTSTLFAIALVLVLPSLLQLQHATTLSSIRAHTTAAESLLHPHSGGKDTYQNDLARALLRSHSTLRNAAVPGGLSGQLAQGWSTPGPDVASGIVLDDVTATIGGKAVLKNISLRLPAGSLTVIVGPATASSTSANALLQLLWAAASGASESSAHSPQMHDGSISFQGRRAQEWNKLALQNQLNFLSATEEPLQIHAGALAGCLPGTAGADLRAALRAQAASGAYGVIAALSAGPGTLVKPALNGDDDERQPDGVTEAELTTDQLKALHVSRALCSVDKPFVLLTNPTDGMSEAQERLFFAYLREQLRPGQVVALTTARLATAAFADHVVVLDERGNATERDNGV